MSSFLATSSPEAMALIFKVKCRETWRQCHRCRHLTLINSLVAGYYNVMKRK